MSSSFENFRLLLLRRYRSINAQFHIFRITSEPLCTINVRTPFYKIVMAEKSRIFAMWSVVGCPNPVGGRWLVVVLVGGWCFLRSLVSGRWFLRSVVGCSSGRWSVVPARWSVPLWSVIGGL